MGKTVLHTPLCDLLGIEYPVILAGMGPVAGGAMGSVATSKLAAAVSNIRAAQLLKRLGFLHAGAQFAAAPDWMREKFLFALEFR